MIFERYLLQLPSINLPRCPLVSRRAVVLDEAKELFLTQMTKMILPVVLLESRCPEIGASLLEVRDKKPPSNLCPPSHVPDFVVRISPVGSMNKLKHVLYPHIDREI